MERKRINISVDPDTYERLKALQKSAGLKNPCELIVALVHILLDRMKSAGQRQIDLPDPDGEYIDSIFDDLSAYEKTPANTPRPKQRRDRYKMEDGGLKHGKG